MTTDTYKPLKTPEELTVDQLARIVRGVQRFLWRDFAAGQWNPDKPWDAETTACIAELMAGFDLVPVEVERCAACEVKIDPKAQTCATCFASEHPGQVLVINE